ncbi:hypothetical protein ACSQ67_004096 [Phaseolus vulgaris]
MARLSIIVLVIMVLVLRTALSELCNPQDKQALLQIKKDLGNPTTLSSWLPNTDCCKPEWEGVSCDTDTKSYRVNILDLNGLSLTKPYPIPSSVGNLPYLGSLYISRMNNLIPNFLSQMKSLITIDFSYNALSGTLPPSLSSLPNLVGISLDGNRISGTIPGSFGSFPKHFTVLTLSRNRLTGNIPTTLAKLGLSFVDLSENMLEGDASVLFGANKNLRKIDLAKNLLAFDLGKISLRSKNLEGLDLRKNRIYGTLPKVLTSLKYLRTLNVSYNNLCGQIPQGGSCRDLVNIVMLITSVCAVLHFLLALNYSAFTK